MTSITDTFPNSATSADPYYADIVFQIDGCNPNPSIGPAMSSITGNIVCNPTIDAVQVGTALGNVDYGNSTVFQLQTDWTIEVLVNCPSWLTSGSGVPTFFCKCANLAAPVEYSFLYYQPSGGFRLDYGINSAGAPTSLVWPFVPVNNTDYYFVLVGNGLSITLYVNGVSQGTLTMSAPIYAGTNHFRIGGENYYSYPNSTFYIKALRITNGVARNVNGQTTYPLSW